jgi:hypothetical protein
MFLIFFYHGLDEDPYEGSECVAPIMNLGVKSPCTKNHIKEKSYIIINYYLHLIPRAFKHVFIELHPRLDQKLT